MEKAKKIGILTGKFLICLVLGSVLTSIMYYLFFSKNTVTIISLIYMILIFFIFAFKNSKKIEKNGYMLGLKQGLLFILILFLFNLIIYHNFKTSNLCYYLILLASSVIGSILGINKNQQ